MAPTNSTPEERANDVIFDAARAAGFEDGTDFKVSEGASSISPRMRAWLQENSEELMLRAAQVWFSNP